jgi:hypothetical protein
MSRGRFLRGTAAVLALVASSAACSGSANDGSRAERLGITTSTAAQATTAPPSTTVTTEAPPTTTLDPAVQPSRLSPGDLTPTRYRTTEFAYDLTFVLPNGAWSTDVETRTAIHLAQTPSPDFAAAAAYDFPLLMLLALPDLDASAVEEIVRDIEGIGFTTASATKIGGRPAVVAEAASRTNPEVASFTGPGGEIFAALGGYWYWDPDVTTIVYRTWVIDMRRGTLVAWYAAPRAVFEANVEAAAAAVESIEFTS